MVNNVSFLSHQHFCMICQKEINMQKVETQIYNEATYQHKPEYLPPIKQDDPIAVRDHGNDIEMVCSVQCFAHYMMMGFNNNVI